MAHVPVDLSFNLYCLKFMPDEPLISVQTDKVVATEDNAPVSQVSNSAVVSDVIELQPTLGSAAVEAPLAVSNKPDRRVGGRNYGGRMGGRRGHGRGIKGKSDIPLESDYEEKNIEIARVTRVTKGGKRMRFRVLTVIGNRKGRVGYGLAKGADVAGATAKATAKARKALFTVPMVNETIPHPIEAKFSAAHILLKPAPKGTGVKAGGAVRIVLALAGLPNVVSKILGSNSKINNVKATFVALRQLRLSGAALANDALSQARGSSREAESKLQIK